MKVHLAGFNVDSEVLRELEEKTGKRQDLTPEVLSAAYARISRDPRPIDEIRQDARCEVERSRKSNSTIIFKMGHHSVAEHAIFNLDIVGVSRLAMEELERFRLCSYTEKSQRYITLDKDFVLPPELKGTSFEKDFLSLIKRQNQAYFELLEKLKLYTFDKPSSLASNPKNHDLLEGWAKEDARYVTSLATEAQVGLTVNARNLELILRRFASCSLAEVRNLGRAIYEQVAEVAPSIIIGHEANDFDQKTYPGLEKLAKEITPQAEPAPGREVQLVEFTKFADLIIAASLLHTSSRLPYEQCLAVVNSLSAKALEDIFQKSWQNMQFYDSVLREFEYANLTFDIILSGACFGQLKRHRMSTITTQDYDPRLGITIPESIKEIKMVDYFKEIITETNQVYQAIHKEIPQAGAYVLTNAHRRRVLMRLNVRELYHVSRLREDAHAQWDIQNISGLMSALAKQVMPLAFSMVGGKDKYKEIYQNIYGKLPKIAEAVLPGARRIK